MNTKKKTSQYKGLPGASRLNWEQQILEWCYVNKLRKFVLKSDPANTDHQLSPAEFDTQYQHLVPRRGKKKHRVKPSNLILNYNHETNVVNSLGMFPGTNARVVSVNADLGLKALNLVTPSRLESPLEPRHPERILNHIHRIFENDPKLYKHFLSWMCHVVFRPGVRIRHGILISGVSKNGKSSLGVLLSKLINPANAVMVDISQVKGSFQDWQIGKRLAVVSEVKAQRNHGFYNHIKSFFTEDRLRLNIKHSGVEVDNHLHFMMFANDEFPMEIEDGNRRIFYHHTTLKNPKDPSMEDALATEEEQEEYYFEKLYEDMGSEWNEIGPGIPDFYHYLKTKILPNLPKNFAYASPPSTPSGDRAIKASQNPVAVLVEEGLAIGEGYFEPGKFFLKSSFMSHLKENVGHMIKANLEVQSTLRKFNFQEARCEINGKRHTIGWFHSEVSADLRDILKDTSKDGLKRKRQRCYDPNAEIYHSEFSPLINEDEEEQEDFVVIDAKNKFTPETETLTLYERMMKEKLRIPTHQRAHYEALMDILPPSERFSWQIKKGHH